MSSARKVASNRANARRSTGPRTPAGRARSSRNAVRHGLSISVVTDPELRAVVMALAGRLAEEGGPLHLGIIIAEATIEAWRVRQRRHEVISAALARPPGRTPEQLGKAIRLARRAATALVRGRAEEAEALMDACEASAPDPNESEAERQARVIAEIAGELRRLDTYERRALSRRKFAIRAFDAAARTGSGHPREAEKRGQ
jgi:hypothetical protein